MKTAVLLVIALAFAQESSGSPGLLGDLVGSILKPVGNLVEDVLKTLDTLIKNLVEALVKLLKDLPAALLGSVKDIVDGINELLQNGAITMEEANQQFNQKMKEELEKVHDVSQAKKDELIKTMSDALAKASDKEEWEKIAKSISEAIEKLIPKEEAPEEQETAASSSS